MSCPPPATSHDLVNLGSRVSSNHCSSSAGSNPLSYTDLDDPLPPPNKTALLTKHLAIPRVSRWATLPSRRKATSPSNIPGPQSLRMRRRFRGRSTSSFKAPRARQALHNRAKSPRKMAAPSRPTQHPKILELHGSGDPDNSASKS